MTDKLAIAMSALGHALKLALKLCDEAPNKDEARAELVARIQRQFALVDGLDAVQAEDLRLLDERLP